MSEMWRNCGTGEKVQVGSSRNIDEKGSDGASSHIPSLFSVSPFGMNRGSPRGPGYPNMRARGTPEFSNFAYPMRPGLPMGRGGAPGYNFHGGRGHAMGGSGPFLGRGPYPMRGRGPPMPFPTGRGGFPKGDPSAQPAERDDDDDDNQSHSDRAQLTKFEKMRRKFKNKKKRKKKRDKAMLKDREEESEDDEGEPKPKRQKVVPLKDVSKLINQISSTLNKPKNYKVFRDTLTYSQWLLEVPPDFEEDWIVVPCPPGKRMLVVAGRGLTRSFTKSGEIIYTFYSALPGGHQVKADEGSNSLTILDCIWHHKSKSYYILDVLHWNNTPFLDSEALFRFSWLEHKLSENPELSEVSPRNEFCFQFLPRHSCAKASISEVMSSDPLVFNDLTVIVDGFMFYNSSSSYHIGDSLAVGWLKPFMVPDILKIDVCNELLVDRPVDYAGVQQFVEEFEKEKRKVIRRERKMRRKKFGEDMHVDEESGEEVEGMEEETEEKEEKALKEEGEEMEIKENVQSVVVQ